MSTSVFFLIFCYLLTSMYVLFSFFSIMSFWDFFCLLGFFFFLSLVIPSPGIMSLLPPSLGGGSGFVSHSICKITHSAPVQSVIDTRIQTMKVFRLLIKLFFLATIMPMAPFLNNNTTFDGIVVYFWKHAIPTYRWFNDLLNIHYGKQMPTAKYDNLFTTNAKNQTES